MSVEHTGAREKGSQVGPRIGSGRDRQAVEIAQKRSTEVTPRKGIGNLRAPWLF